jgi:NitT/TauT family transport system substrate-binding protein
LLAEAGIDLERDNVTIVSPPAMIDGRWMGHAGAEAIKLGRADAYWATACDLPSVRLGILA